MDEPINASVTALREMVDKIGEGKMAVNNTVILQAMLAAVESFATYRDQTNAEITELKWRVEALEKQIRDK